MQGNLNTNNKKEHHGSFIFLPSIPSYEKFLKGEGEREGERKTFFQKVFLSPSHL